VSSESVSAGVLVDSALLVHEVGIDGESHSDGSVCAQFGLQSLHSTHTLVGGALVLVAALGDAGVAAALLIAGGGHLGDSGAVGQSGRSHVVCTLGHCLGLALGVVPVVASSDDARMLEPGPGGADLASVAAHGEAAQEAAAAGGVCGREQGGGASLDAEPVVEGFGGAVSPAGPAVTLVAGMVDHVLALRPLVAGVERLGQTFTDKHFAQRCSDLDVGVNHSAKLTLDVVLGVALELLVEPSHPGVLD